MRDARRETRDARRETRDARRETRDARRETRDARRETRDARREAQDARSKIRATRYLTQDTRYKIQGNLHNFSTKRTLYCGQYKIINTNYISFIFHTFTLLMATVTRLHNLVIKQINKYLFKINV